MKITDGILICFFSLLLNLYFFNSFKTCLKMNEESIALKSEYNCIYFCSESFKRSCSRKGFENLEEWKRSCQALFNNECLKFEEDKEEGILKGSFYYGKKKIEVFCKSEEIEK